MPISSNGKDIAGREYWDKNWSAPVPAFIDPMDSRPSNAVNQKFHTIFSSIIDRSKDASRRLLEVGCARSVWLPYFAIHHDLEVAGIDYSQEGCRQEEAILEMVGVKGKVVCADLFSHPANMIAAYDYVVTFGVVEHFMDTAACICALAKYLSPGGMMINVIPNMFGTVGLLQRLIDKKVHDLHIPMGPEQFAAFHENAGLMDISSRYVLSTNNYVVNSSHKKGTWSYVPLRTLHAAMGRASMFVWFIEKIVGQLPTSRAFSPYVICTARKP